MVICIWSPMVKCVTWTHRSVPFKHSVLHYNLYIEPLWVYQFMLCRERLVVASLMSDWKVTVMDSCSWGYQTGQWVTSTGSLRTEWPTSNYRPMYSKLHMGHAVSLDSLHKACSDNTPHALYLPNNGYHQRSEEQVYIAHIPWQFIRVITTLGPWK